MTLFKNYLEQEIAALEAESGGSVLTGHGTPQGTLTPPETGLALYVDLESGAVYTAPPGASNVDWVSIGGQTTGLTNGTIGGVGFNSNQLWLVAESTGQVGLATASGAAGQGNYIRWRGADGVEAFEAFTGSSGQFVTTIADPNGDGHWPGKVKAVGGIGVGNSAAATTPGTVIKKMEIFDASGVSLGFIPIYDAII